MFVAWLCTHPKSYNVLAGLVALVSATKPCTSSNRASSAPAALASTLARFSGSLATSATAAATLADQFALGDPSLVYDGEEADEEEVRRGTRLRGSSLLPHCATAAQKAAALRHGAALLTRLAGRRRRRLAEPREELGLPARHLGPAEVLLEA